MGKPSGSRELAYVLDRGAANHDASLRGSCATKRPRYSQKSSRRAARRPVTLRAIRWIAGVAGYFAEYEHGRRIAPTCTDVDAISAGDRITLVTDNGSVFKGAAFARSLTSRPQSRSEQCAVRHHVGPVRPQLR